MLGSMFRIAGALGLLVAFERARGKSVSAFFGEYNLADCKCHYVEQLTDGTSRSWRVPNVVCKLADEGLARELEQCEASVPVDLGDASPFPFSFGDKTTDGSF